MMLTIHGLPSSFNYHELKMMIKHESSLNDFILDNLVTDEDGGKKVRVGVADESEGSHLVKCLDGFRLRGNVLRVVPVAKAINSQQGGFNQRPSGYPPRNDVPSQPSNYNNQPAGPIQSRPGPWAANNNQWAPNQGPGLQAQQNNFGFQQTPNRPYTQQQQALPQQQQAQRPDPKQFNQRDTGNRIPPREQAYGFPPKNTAPEANQIQRRPDARQLRSVQVVPTEPHARAPQPQPSRYADKPVTINKDYFQGSNQFGAQHAGGPQGAGHFPPPAQSQQGGWIQSLQPVQKSPVMKPAFEEERKYPPSDKRPAALKEPEARDNAYKDYEKGRYSPHSRRPDAPRRSPGRRSPNRRPSPDRRAGGRSPRRLESPPRADRRDSPSRHAPRFSPTRRGERGDRGDKGDKFPSATKQVRPAYEPEAANQAMYSGGYRPNESAQYPPRDRRASPWQRDDFVPKKDERADPATRDRSPLRDRYRRHSPSPRSPRRSWALEKRRSPPLHDAPPPPVWPGRAPDEPYKDDKPKHPAWDRRLFEEPEDARRDRRPEPPFKDDARARRDLAPPPREPSPRASGFKPDQKTQRVSRFEPVQKFDARDPKFDARDSKFDARDPKFDARDSKFDARDPKFDARDPKYDARDPKFDARDPKFDARDPKFDVRDPKFEARGPIKFDIRDSKFDVRDPKFDARDPKFDARDPKFDRRDPKFDQRDKFESRDPKFDMRDPKFDSRNPKFEPRDPKFDPREPKFEPRGEPKFAPRDPKFEPRDPKFAPRDPKFEPRDPKFEPRDPKFEPRDPKFEPRDPKFEPRDPKFEPRDPKFDSRDPKFEPRDPKFDSRDPKFEPRDPKFQPRDHKYGPRDPKFEPREPQFEPRDPKFDRRDPNFEPREPVFEPRDPKFDSRDPKFEPRNPNFEQRNPKFEPRDPKLEPRDPKFEPRDPKFKPRDAKFDSRDPKFDRPGPKFEPREFPRPDRRDTRHGDGSPDRRGYQDRGDFQDFHMDDDGHREDDYRRDDYRRDDRRGEVFDKEFDDIYKRAVEFKQKVQELKRTGHSRDREEYRDQRDERRGKYHEDSRRDDYRHLDMDREERPRSRDQEFGRRELDAASKAKREKAAEEIAEKIVEKHAAFSMNDDVRNRVLSELKFSVLGIINDMFGREDVTFIETVIKFKAAHSDRDEYKIFQNVMGSLPNHKSTKRSGEDSSEVVPAKTSRRSPEKLTQESTSTKPAEIQNWEYNMGQSDLMTNMMMTQMLMNQTMNPLMVPSPFAPAFDVSSDQLPAYQQQVPEQVVKEDGYNLYLCKTDFKPYTSSDAEFLKSFIVSELLKATETAQGWAPDITLKGLQSQFRYQVHTFDEASKDWLLGVDFSRLNVLTYTKEELWYERAAIWLPGHSRCRNIEPLEKLRLQNKKLEGADIGKWKFVRKVVNAKGTRIYIDMPPASARALEKQKMLLSYELQKVNVFLKAVAVDKDAFDSGLRELSVSDQSDISAAVQNSPMPSLANDPHMIKITLKGCKTMSLMQARKIKEIIIYNMFKYHQSAEVTGRTDFVKYGFIAPDCFGIVPENEESKRWLTSLNIGRMNKHPIVVVGVDDQNIRYIRMMVTVPYENNLKPAWILEQLRKSNYGVKGINFTLWKPDIAVRGHGRKCTLNIDIDLESVETIVKMKYKLDYEDDRCTTRTATFSNEHSTRDLEQLIETYKAEMKDSYDVANMDISQSDSDDDIVYLG